MLFEERIRNNSFLNRKLIKANKIRGQNSEWLKYFDAEFNLNYV